MKSEGDSELGTSVALIMTSFHCESSRKGIGVPRPNHSMCVIRFRPDRLDSFPVFSALRSKFMRNLVICKSIATFLFCEIHDPGLAEDVELGEGMGPERM